jgi:hypothetical protein
MIDAARVAVWAAGSGGMREVLLEVLLMAHQLNVKGRQASA